MKKKSIAIIGGCLAVAVALGALVFPQISTSKADDPYSGYEQLTAHSGQLLVTATGNGFAQAKDSSTLYAPTTAKVEELLVKTGEEVDGGQTIARLSSDSLTQQIEAARQNLEKVNKGSRNISLSKSERRITAPVKGTVKLLAVKGDSAQVIGERYGALAYISLDEAMLVTLDAVPGIREGSGVTLVTAQGDMRGTVLRAHNAQDKTEILLDTDTPPIQWVTVLGEGRQLLGEGLLMPRRAVPVTATLGTIAKVEVAENDEVSQGATLYRLEEDYTEAALNFFDQQRAAQDALDTLLRKRDELAVRAPYDGVITGWTVTEGETTQEGRALGTLQSRGDYEVVAAIDEMDIALVKPGQTATVTLDALPGQVFQATVLRSSAAGNYKSGVTTYDVTLGLSPDATVRAGMSAKVAINVAQKDNALLLPKRAIAYAKSDAYVLTPSGEVPVTLGLADGEQVEILSGIAAGQTVLVKQAKQDTLTPFSGMRTMSGN